MQRVYEAITSRLPEANTTVILRGESGTGKELVARLLGSQQRPRGQAIYQPELRAPSGELIEDGTLWPRKGRLTAPIPPAQDISSWPMEERYPG